MVDTLQETLEYVRRQLKSQGLKEPESLQEVFSEDLWWCERMIIDGKYVDIRYKRGGLGKDAHYIFESIPPGVSEELLIKAVNMANINYSLSESSYARVRHPIINTKTGEINLGRLSPCDGEDV